MTLCFGESSPASVDLGVQTPLDLLPASAQVESPVWDVLQVEGITKECLCLRMRGCEWTSCSHSLDLYSFRRDSVDQEGLGQLKCGQHWSQALVDSKPLRLQLLEVALILKHRPALPAPPEEVLSLALALLLAPAPAPAPAPVVVVPRMVVVMATIVEPPPTWIDQVETRFLEETEKSLMSEYSDWLSNSVKKKWAKSEQMLKLKRKHMRTPYVWDNVPGPEGLTKASGIIDPSTRQY